MKRYAILRFIQETLEDDGFQSFIIFGSKGAGKSTYALRVAAQYYHFIEKKPTEESWREAIKTVAFTIYEVLQKIDEGRKIIIWDDAGLWLSTYMWYDEKTRKYLEYFNDYWDVIRTDAYVIMFTTPTKKKLPPKVREDSSAILVRITKIPSTTKVCKMNKQFKLLYECRYVKMSLAEGARNVEGLYDDRTLRKLLFTDYFIRYVPDKYWAIYQKKRKSYSRYARKQLERIIQEIFPIEIYDIENTLIDI